MAYTEFIARAVLALVFLAAANNKAHHPGPFVKTIRRLGIPARVAPIVAWLVIAYEGILGFLLVLGIVPEATALGALVLLAIFAGVSINALQWKRAVLCNCFGASEILLGRATLARSLLLVVTAGLYYFAFHSVRLIWWPQSFDIAVICTSLVIGMILFARWLLATPTVITLVRDRSKYINDGRDDALRADMRP